MQNSAPNSLRPEVLPALVLQSVILVLAGMVLDGGELFQVCFYAFVAFWGGILVLHFQKRNQLSKVDIFFVRYGYILVCVVSFFITRWIWYLRGFGGHL